MKVECIEVVEGEKIKEVKIFEVFPSTPVDEFQKKACKRFCKWEDWRYGLYSTQNSAWMTSGLMGDYNLKPMVFHFFTLFFFLLSFFLGPFSSWKLRTKLTLSLVVAEYPPTENKKC